MAGLVFFWDFSPGLIEVLCLDASSFDFFCRCILGVSCSPYKDSSPIELELHPTGLRGAICLFVCFIVTSLKALSPNVEIHSEVNWDINIWILEGHNSVHNSHYDRRLPKVTDGMVKCMHKLGREALLRIYHGLSKRGKGTENSQYSPGLILLKTQCLTGGVLQLWL